MSASDPPLLLLAGGATGEYLAERLGPDACLHVPRPYAGLAEMADRTWPTVVLADDGKEFPGLCRAARRLQPEARLLGICGPAGEPRLRPLRPRPLDDYFIEPLTAREVAGLLGAGPPRGEEAPAALASRDAGEAFADLVHAARTVAGLERHLVGTVSRRVGGPVAWLDADRVDGGSQTLLVGDGRTPRVLVPRGALRLGSEAEAYLQAVQQSLPALLDSARRMQRLHRLSVTDHLTGASNRRHFYRRTDQILFRAAREGFRVTLLLYDIDDFKRYNDTYGHAAGDEILRDTASLMRQITREHDVVARIGGDEFAVLFWDEQQRSPDSQPPETAYALADRFRQAVTAHRFPSLGPDATGTLTISGGLASYPGDGRNVRDLLSRADAALAKAKASGKNAIRLIGSDEE